MAEYLLPADSKRILRNINNEYDYNLYLLANKLIDKETIVTDKSKFKINKKKLMSLVLEKDWQNTDNYKGLLPQLQKRSKEAAKGLFGEAACRSMLATTETRVIIGLGGASIYENSISLHHIYGIPYLPGTALKGVTRSAIIQECFQGKEEQAFKDRGFCMLFGSDDTGITKARKGAVIVMDVFPQKFKLNMDVMTPHYKNYYEGKGFPKDTENPVMIAFVASEDMACKIYFGLASDGVNGTIIEDGIFKGREYLEVFTTYLKKSLEEYGIGAKTSAGYGYFHCECVNM